MAGKHYDQGMKVENWKVYDMFGRPAYEKGEYEKDRISRKMRKQVRRRHNNARANSFRGQQTEENAAFWGRVEQLLVNRGMSLDAAKKQAARELGRKEKNK